MQRNGDLAFELHQRLQEGEAGFEELAACYSEGDERHNGGRIGPVPSARPIPRWRKNYASASRANSTALLFVNIWLICASTPGRGPAWMKTRSELLQEIFNDWLHQRVMRLLDGEQPDPLPPHLLSQPSSDVA